MSAIVEEVKETIFNIINKIDNNWNLNQKIRFVYLKLGEILEKNTDFFENSKLYQYGLTQKEMFDIYENNSVSVVERNGNKQYQIICKSAALFLKTAYDFLGIESSFVHTVNSIDGVLHWFVVAKGDNEEQFFLTLAADLPFIKNNFPTEHFTNSSDSDIECVVKHTISTDNNFTSKEKLLNRIKRLNQRVNEYLMYKINDYNILVVKKSDLPYFEIDCNITPTDITKDFLNEMPDECNVEFLERYYETKDINDKINLSKREIVIDDINISYNEISHECLVNKIDILYDLDNSIGYGKLYENLGLVTSLNYKNYYYTILEEESEVFEIFKESFGISPGVVKKIDKITLEEVDNFKKKIEKYLLDELNKRYYLNMTDLREYIYISIQLKDTNDFNLSLNELMKKYKKDLKKCEDEERYITDLIQSILFIENSFYDFLDISQRIDNLMKNSNISDEDFLLQYNDLIDKYDKAKIALNVNKLNLSLYKIAYELIKKDILIDNKENVSTEYIINKFTKMFPIIFDCNYGDYKTTKINNFSSLGYSEQIVIIKMLLKKVFSELTKWNCKNIKKYNYLYTPLENRLRIFPLKNKKTGEYCIGFRFTRTESEDLNDNDEYVYIPSENLLRKRNPLRDQQTYWIVSRSLNSRLSEIESNEEDEINYYHK